MGTPKTIEHIIVIYLANRSFNNLFGTFPGAEGLVHAGLAGIQRDLKGKLYDTLPAILKAGSKLPAVDARFPLLPNKPLPIDAFLPGSQRTRDLVHRFYQEQMQINGGKMDLSDGLLRCIQLGTCGTMHGNSFWRTTSFTLPSAARC
ncbi:MAG: hypothetical protein KGJ86_02655 [Chloroflexota bacterium]|nr:hypothetical protein [Chloroflexota bacterium]